MRIFYTVIFVLTFSSNIFAYDYEAKEPLNAYIMTLSEQGKEIGDAMKKRINFNVICIDGYRYLFTRNGVTQMMFYDVGRNKMQTCPIEKPQEK
jgi:hypothetical protein